MNPYPRCNNGADLKSIPIGSVVSLAIDNGDGGIGVILEYIKNRGMYRVYRLPPHDDKMLVYAYECYIEWTPNTLNI